MPNALPLPLPFAVAALALCLALPVAAQTPVYHGPGLVRTEVAPGVHAFVWDNSTGGAANVDGNTVAIINEHDVVVIDAQWTPATSAPSRIFSERDASPGVRGS